jgi:competence protein ComFB
MHNVHNVIEDMVFAEIDNICASIDEIGEDGSGEPHSGEICTCPQCRIQAACYVLNRVQPFYIVSSRGLVRAEQMTMRRQQQEADIAVLAYDALKMVKQNQRENTDHSRKAGAHEQSLYVYNFPAIVGRIFHGLNFAPISDASVELYGENLLERVLFPMLDENWQNPCPLISKTEGGYTFLPQPMAANAAGEHTVARFSVQCNAPGFNPLSHHFEIPVTSEVRGASSDENRTFRVLDLYAFPKGGDEEE